MTVQGHESGVDGSLELRATPPARSPQSHPFWSRDVGRASSFSDAIFAIALTLPVLEFKLPGESQAVWPHLWAEWPALLAFLVTFAVGSNLWLSHYRLFDAITRMDERILQRNVVFLFLFTLLPFSTALVMHGGDQAVAVVLYASNVAALYLALSGVTGKVLHHGEIRPEAGWDLQLSRASTHALGGLFIVEALVACWVPTLALWFPLLIPLVLRLVRRTMLTRLIQTNEEHVPSCTPLR